MTREFTLHRYAFGRPVASFQAIKHRSPTSTPRSSSRTRTPTTAPGRSRPAAPSSPVAACGARVAASEAFDLAGKEMIQMHGGVGFTWEYDCHLFYRRAKLLVARARHAGRVAREADPRLDARAATLGRPERRPWTSTTPPKKPRSAPRRAPGSRRTRSCAPPGESRAGPARRAEANEAPARAREGVAGEEGRREAGPCLTWPNEFGGRGASAIQNVIFGTRKRRSTTCRRTCSGSATGMLGPTIMAHGTPEQKKRYLEPMLRARRGAGASSSASRPRAPISRACAPPR